MKYTSKIFAGIFAAAVMASAAVSVSAADYSLNPGYDDPSTVVEITAEDLANALDEVEEGDTIEITAAAGAKFTKEAIEALKDAGVKVEIVSDGYTVTIDSITDAKDIDLSMTVGVATDDTKVEGIAIPAGSVVIAPAANGDFGCTVTVTVATDLEDANLYYIDDEGAVSEVADGLKIEDGVAYVTISHASTYVISAEPIEGASSDTPDTGVTLPIALVALAGGSVAVSAIVAKKRK